MNSEKKIKEMTLEEKAAFLSGKTVFETRGFERLGIPSIFLSDGPHGLRKQAGAADHLGLNAALPATCFPTAATAANSWDEALGEEIGKALGEEALALGVQVLLGPGLNIKRSPLCGRNFEYFSEDPYLSGKMAASYIRGIQSNGIYACPKHFAVNSQEERRMASNSVLDERTLRELYLTGFEIAVKEGQAKCIMSSYNQVNNVYANENEHLLKEILRREWGFSGMVVTDWGGSNNHVQGVAAGSDLEMPCPGLESARELVQAVKDGRLKEEDLDACVRRLLHAAEELGEKKQEETGEISEKQQKEHHELARRVAAESMVLLKNEAQLLPLDPSKKIALIGDFVYEPRFQGAGSSAVNVLRLDCLKQIFDEGECKLVGCCKGYERSGKENAALIQEAVSLARSADLAIVCFGLDETKESEGIDRSDMKIPENQVQLLEAVAEANENTVGILCGGASVEAPWDRCCRALLYAGLSGQAGAGAIYDVLIGRVNPSGKLAETYPICQENTPVFDRFPAKQRNAEYREGLYIGYRYYDTVGAEVRYPFGYGLSYTTFQYSDLKISETGVRFTLTNSGNRDGAEISQLYVRLPNAAVFRPEKELKGFVKTKLKAGESRSVEILFDDKTFRYWNRATGKWEIEAGEYQILIGASSRDIRLQGTTQQSGTGAALPYRRELLSSYYAGTVKNVPDLEFEELLGHSIPEESCIRELDENDAICQIANAKSIAARAAFRILDAIRKKSEKKGKPDLNILFIYNMPFRGIAKMTNGMVSMEMVHGLVQIVNGHFGRGLVRVIRGYFKNQRENRKYEKTLSATGKGEAK